MEDTTKIVIASVLAAVKGMTETGAQLMAQPTTKVMCDNARAALRLARGE